MRPLSFGKPALAPAGAARRRGACRSRFVKGAAAAWALLAAGLVAAAASPARAQQTAPFSLGLPLDCQPGLDCWIATYFDADPGPDAADFRCGRRTSDRHRGIDFAIRDEAAMADGVPVIAAAPGIVSAVRDGVEDVNVRRIGLAAVKGRECGNGVLIDHGNGWQTQYCHMRRGSIGVARGDRVTAGQPLGLVGLSGLTEFPHLHLAVRFRGKALDPFVGLDRSEGCGKPGKPLWQPEALRVLPYREFIIFNTGFAPHAPRVEDVRKGAYREVVLPRTAEALVVWVEVFGVAAGDRLVLKVLDPDGVIVVGKERVIEKDQARYFQFTGRKRPGRVWPAGVYRAEIALTRPRKDGSSLTQTVRRELEIR